ncbi:MAG: four helix bundle protein [Saprospiraceae bacterium]|nr:four helix bundle protein [Saprospiraceae bacterium]
MVDYRKYKVWEKSHDFALQVYQLTKSFPDSEKFNLIAQLRRAATSIPTNISEGAGRETNKEFVRFLYIASGSAHESHYLLFLSKELGYANQDAIQECLQLAEEIKKMLAALIRKIKSSSNF